MRNGGRGHYACSRRVSGIDDEYELEDILHGRSTRRLQVPPGLREALLGAGLHRLIAPVNLVTVHESGQMLVNNDAWEDLEFGVALDSCAVVHVCTPADCQGCILEQSPGSRRGQQFLTRRWHDPKFGPEAFEPLGRVNPQLREINFPDRGCHQATDVSRQDL